MKTKICPVCRKAKPHSEYYVDRAKRDGIASTCKVCVRKRVKLWAENNHERTLERAMEWRLQHPGHMKAWREENKDRLMEYSRQYYTEHRDRIIQVGRDYAEKNKETILAKQRRYHANNRDARNAVSRKWKEDHPEWSREYAQKNADRYAAIKHRRRAKILGNGGSYTAMEWFDLCESHDWLCLCCGKHSYESPLTVDHVVPVTKGGSSGIDNLQGLCRSCNSAKSTKTTDYRLEQNMHPAVLSHLQTTRNLRDSITVLLQSTLQDI